MAPAKMILCGEHTVVHGSGAIVQALPLWTRVQIDPLTDNRVFVTSSLGSFESCIEKGQLGNGPTETTFQWLSRLLEILRLDCGFRMEIHSDIIIGSGMGSSASVISAAIVALLRAFPRQFSKPVTWKGLWDMAKEVESVCHGKSSGIDLAACLLGGRLYFQQGTIRRLPSTPIPSLYYYFSGKPSDVTASCVKVSSCILEKKPQLLTLMRENLQQFEYAIQTSSFDQQMTCVKAAHRALIQLGVTPPEIQDQISEIEFLGGAAKISGAGSLQGPGAGMILVLAKDPVVKMLNERFHLKVFPQPCSGALGDDDDFT